MQKNLNVAVVGAGLMGHGIAQVFATAGHHTTITDTSNDALQAAPSHIRRNLELMQIEPLGVLDRIRLCGQLADAVAGADLVIEAAPERIELKQRLFGEIAEAAPQHAILASNTSVIPITEIGERLDKQARFRLVGTHWWNPPHLVPLVEVVCTRFTSDAVFDDTFDILRAVGKCPVKVYKDVPGFIGNRLQHALWREAISLVHRGVCDAETIDTVVKQSFGMRLPVLGPMENADLVGLELARNVHQIIFPDLDNATEPSPLLLELIDGTHLGMRTGKGLRDWTPEQADQVRQKLALHLISANDD
ncbi:3-hydroxyacyl-CoA dehydrogenase family protein [Burkholderia sp. SRS-W-2-2016]|uniref:3-hydroxyacyl-CoA dehydrogenase family protein n=1 Tax=Burkholderia sp. SRS-W-2-2016 TaxID=1926878 RepID=UPI000AAC42F0|nr:3-hydroxyacyl-CoA dehydrogenase family protein [Burkholderia sp. SRS-W-2-2016]